MVANTVLNETLYIFIITHNEIIMKIQINRETLFVKFVSGIKSKFELLQSAEEVLTLKLS